MLLCIVVLCGQLSCFVAGGSPRPSMYVGCPSHRLMLARLRGSQHIYVHDDTTSNHRRIFRLIILSFLDRLSNVQQDSHTKIIVVLVVPLRDLFPVP